MSAAAGSSPIRMRAVLIALLLAGETVYFGSRCAAGFARLLGERAYFSGDSLRAWWMYDRAAGLGSDRVQILTDRAEVLLYGLDQQNLGMKVDLPFERDGVPAVARTIVGTLLASAPYRSYFWSLAADVYTAEALASRRSVPLDLSTLSDDPLVNLLPEEGLAVAALREAARREPHNYLYDDLMAEHLVQWGLVDLALPHVRRALALYPVLDGHIYLSRPRLEPEIVDAAVAGLGEARSLGSMVPDDSIECDAGRLLVSQGRHQEALGHLKAALDIAPGNSDAVYWYGLASFLLGDDATAVDYLSRAGEALPDSPWLWYQLGQALMRLGRRDEGIAALRRAREQDPKEVQFRHTLGGALEDAGSLKDAERQFQAAANFNPGNTTAWSALVGFYERHPEFGDAARQVCSRLRRSRLAQETYKERCEALARKTR